MPYLLTATPSSPTSWVKMETESVLSGHSEMSNRSRHNLNNLNNKQHRNNYSAHIPKSNLSVNNFPTLPPIPSMPPTLTSLSNYSLSRNHTNLNNQNYYHLGLQYEVSLHLIKTVHMTCDDQRHVTKTNTYSRHLPAKY